jgi:hypothetical protein
MKQAAIHRIIRDFKQDVFKLYAVKVAKINLKK